MTGVGCEDGLKNVSSVYHLGDQIDSTDVYCDMTSDGGGWAVGVAGVRVGQWVQTHT